MPTDQVSARDIMFSSLVVATCTDSHFFHHLYHLEPCIVPRDNYSTVPNTGQAVFLLARHYYNGKKKLQCYAVIIIVISSH